MDFFVRLYIFLLFNIFDGEISEFIKKWNFSSLKIYYAFLLFLVFFNMLDLHMVSLHIADIENYLKWKGKWTGSER